MKHFIRILISLAVVLSISNINTFGRTVDSYLSSSSMASMAETPTEPAIPSVRTWPYCGSTKIESAVSMPANTRYYFQGTNSAGTSRSIVLPYTMKDESYNSGTFYIRAYNSSTRKWSKIRSVYITIKEKPGLPVLPGNRTICGAGNVTLSIASPAAGVTYEWLLNGSPYAESADTSKTVSLTNGQTKKYKIRAYINSNTCTTASEGEVIVKSTLRPAIPAASNKERCGPGNITFTASVPGGSSIKWYNGTLTSSNENYTINISSDKTVEVVRIENGCESERKSVLAKVIQKPPKPIISSEERINSGELTFEVPIVSGTRIEYYLGTNTTPNFSEGNFTHAFTETTQIKARRKNDNNQCYSDQITIMATIIQLDIENQSEAVGDDYLLQNTVSGGGESPTYYDRFNVDGTGGEFIWRLKSNASWNLDSIPDWIDINNAYKSGSATGGNFISIPVKYSSNFNAESRAGNLNIVTGDVSTPIYFAQESKSLKATVNPGSYLLARTISSGNENVINQYDVLGDIGEMQIEIESEADWNLEVTQGNDWLTISNNSGNAGTASSKISYKASNGEVRTGIVNLKHGATQVQELRVKQLATVRAIWQKPKLTEDENYVHTITPTEAYTSGELEEILTNENGLLENNGYVDAGDIRHQITYFDGLGRPKQDIVVQGSPDYLDVVVPHVYDDLGREATQYLSFNYLDEDETGKLHGAIVKNPVSEQEDFYADIFPGQELYANSETDFEPSPLNRIWEKSAPGSVWKIERDGDNSTLEGHTIKLDYATNLAYEVRYWDGNSSTSFSSTRTYNKNELFLTITKDENWVLGDDDLHTTHEFKDKSGNVVLKRSFVEDGNGGVIDIATYYVYNNFNLLVGVIPPDASQLAGSPTTNYTFNIGTDQLCYWYKYNDKKQMVEKKLPGAEPVKMLYDKRDRLIATQDGNIRSENEHKWLFTKYDIYNRPIMTGWVVNANLESEIESQSVFGEEPGPALKGYTNDALPQISEEDLLTVTYYDNYDNLPSEDFGYKTPDITGLNSTLYQGFEPVCSENTKTLNTISQERIIGTDTWLTTILYYDEKGRVIQTVANNHLEGFTRISMKFSWFGELIATVTEQSINEGTGEYSLVVEGQRFTYDQAGRQLATFHQIAGMADETLLTENTYNKLGQVKSKALHNGVETTNFNYNIRGWLNRINGEGNEGLFHMNIFYDELGTLGNLTDQVNYSGNISAISWADKYYSINNAYGYKYDGLNRLKEAQYGNASGAAYIPINIYSVPIIDYDLNGNILTLQRYGSDETGLMDNLSYNYFGNKLIGVGDNEVVVGGFSDGIDQFAGDNSTTENESSWEYLYDDNGNMHTDHNKGISNIAYNHLNLPQTLTTPNGQVDYLYTANGAKLKNTNSMGKETDYLGSFVYEKEDGESRKLSYILTNEVRINIGATPGSFEYEYFLKDHLGNTRVTFADKDSDGTISSDEIGQLNDYYPFGMRHNIAGGFQESSNNKYLYNGKELQDDTEWYDYGFRFYDPALGRFPSLDPLADKFHWVSPYNYAENSPIANVDWWGLQKVHFSYALDQNQAYRNIYQRQRRTSGGQKFNRALKSQKKYDVYYYIYNSNATEGRVSCVSNKEDFLKQRKSINDLKSIPENQLDGLFEDGKKMILIGIDENYAKDENNKEKQVSGTKVLNHEEVAHGLDYVDDGENNNSSSEDHEGYFGEGTYTTPEDSEIQTEEKYKSTEARQQLDEIDQLYEDENNNP